MRPNLDQKISRDYTRICNISKTYRRKIFNMQCCNSSPGKREPKCSIICPVPAVIALRPIFNLHIYNVCTYFFCFTIPFSLMYINRKSHTIVVTPSNARPDPMFNIVFFKLNCPPRPSTVRRNCESIDIHISNITSMVKMNLKYGN